jgi:F0F1-type ATP synthase assembly protein I
MTAEDRSQEELDRFLERRRAKGVARAEAGRQYRSYLRWSGRALELPAAVVVGLLLGRFIGDAVGAKEIGTWLGLAFGVATAVRSAYRLVKAYQREEADA